MKITTPSKRPLINFLLLLCLPLFFSNCGKIQKLFSKQKQSSSNQSSQFADSTGLKKSDSVNISQKDSLALAKKLLQADAGIEVIFYDTNHQNGVQVVIDKGGKQTLTATGAIHSVKTSGGYSQQSQDSIHTSVVTTATKHSSDSAATKNNASSNTTSQSKSVIEQKSSWQLPWYVYLFLFILIILAIAYWRYRQTIKRIFS